MKQADCVLKEAFFLLDSLENCLPIQETENQERKEQTNEKVPVETEWPDMVSSGQIALFRVDVVLHRLSYGASSR